MNWSQGLFRLWIVFSVLWMAFAFLAMETFETLGDYLDGQLLRTDIAADELSISPVDGGIATVTIDGRSLEVDPGGVRFGDEEWAPMLDALAKKMNQDAAQNNARIRRARADVLAGIGLATLPPLAVLVFGASLLWAVRGFAGEHKK